MTALEFAPALPVSKPAPIPSPELAPYWEAARAHRLVLPYCRSCRRFWFPPSRLCRHCLSDETEWNAVSGRGHVCSFVVVHRVTDAAFSGEAPYVVAIIELEESPRLISNVVADPEHVYVGMAVKVIFDDVSSGASVPRFVPDEEGGEPTPASQE